MVERLTSHADVLIGQLGLNDLLQSPDEVPPDPYEMGVEADPAKILRTGELEKMCSGAKELWQKRQGTLTDEWFGWSTIGESLVVEVIPLLDVTDVITTGETDEDFDPMLLHRKEEDKNKTDTSKYRKENKKSSLRSFDELRKDKLVVFTDVEGRNSGKTFWFRTKDEAEAAAWCENIRSHSTVAKKNNWKSKHTPLQRVRLFARRMYTNEIVQIVFAVIIGLNFVTNVAEAQVVPDKGSSEEKVFNLIDIFFTAAFGFELAWNMFSHGYKEFWYDGWNVFDFFVVTFSVLALVLDSIPVLSSLRLLRVFRAVRLFKKLSSLRILFNALLGSIIPVLNSVFILVIITAMYSIVGVELFGEKSELFLDFTQAMFTMYQVATGDSWASGVARGLLQTDPDQEGVMPFFVSYTVITGMILLNVVVAVLLDNFTRCVAEEESAIQQAKAAQAVTRAAKSSQVLDPILKDLINYENEQHLEEMIAHLFEVVDGNGSGSLSFEELRVGIRKLETRPPIVLSQDDFDIITHDRVWTVDNGYIDPEFWFRIVLDQLQTYTRRRMADALREHHPSSAVAVELMALKMALARTELDWYSDVDALVRPHSPSLNYHDIAGPPPSLPPPSPPPPNPRGGSRAGSTTPPRSILRDTSGLVTHGHHDGRVPHGRHHSTLNGMRPEPVAHVWTLGPGPSASASQAGSVAGDINLDRRNSFKIGGGGPKVSPKPGNTAPLAKTQLVAGVGFMSMFEAVGKAFSGSNGTNGHHNEEGSFGGGLVSGGGAEIFAREMSSRPEAALPALQGQRVGTPKRNSLNPSDVLTM